MDPVSFRPRRLAHVNLYVSDLVRSVAFYERTCGLIRVRSETAIRAQFLSNGSTHHDLGLIEVSRGADRHGRDGRVQIASTRGTAPGLNHLGWEMETEAELVAAYRRLLAAGLRPTALFDHVVSHAIYVADPDGNVHEFYADTMKDWRSVFNLDTDDLVTSQWDPLAAPPVDEPRYDPAPVLSTPPADTVPTQHVSGATFATRRFDEMLRFMQEVAGLAVVERRDAPARVAVLGGRCGRRELVLREAAAGEATGFRSFSLKLAAGARAEAMLRQLPADRVRARLDDASRVAAVVADPDGHEVELYAPRRDEVLAPLAAAA